MESDEEGIDTADDGVVDLEVADLRDPPRRVFSCRRLIAPDLWRAMRGTAVAVGGRGRGSFWIRGGLFSGEIHGGHFVLGEEHDVGGFHAGNSGALSRSRGWGRFLCGLVMM